MGGPVVNKVVVGVGEAVKGGVGAPTVLVGRWRRVGGPKFRACFFSSPVGIFALFLSLSLSLGCLLVEFWWCLKRRGAQMCTFGVLWLSCEAPPVPKHKRHILAKLGLAKVGHDRDICHAQIRTVSGITLPPPSVSVH